MMGIGRQTPAEPQAEKPKSVRKRVEENAVIYMVTACAAVAGATATTTKWMIDTAWDARVTTLGHNQREEKNAALTEQAQRYLTQIATLKIEMEHVERENDTLRRATAKFKDCWENERCDRHFLQDRFQPVIDPEELIAEGSLAAIYDGRIFVPRAIPPGSGYRTVSRGSMHSFTTDPSFDLASAERQGTELVEHIWQVGDAVEIEDHPQLQRFQAYFSVYNHKILGNGAASERVDPVWNVFNEHLRARNTAAGWQKMRPRLRQVEGMGAGALFAHYQTVLKNVVIDGEKQRRAFLNEQILYVRGGADGREVFVIRSVFLSKGRRVEQAAEWASVLDWWTKLVVKVG